MVLMCIFLMANYIEYMFIHCLAAYARYFEKYLFKSWIRLFVFAVLVSWVHHISGISIIIRYIARKYYLWFCWRYLYFVISFTESRASAFDTILSNFSFVACTFVLHTHTHTHTSIFTSLLKFPELSGLRQNKFSYQELLSGHNPMVAPSVWGLFWLFARSIIRELDQKLK